MLVGARWSCWTKSMGPPKGEDPFQCGVSRCHPTYTRQSEAGPLTRGKSPSYGLKRESPADGLKDEI